LISLAGWLLVAGCGFSAQSGGAGDDNGGGGSGGSSTMPDGGGCAWATQFDACALPAAPPSPLKLIAPTVWKFDTHGPGSFVGTAPPAMTFVIASLPQGPGTLDAVVLYTSAFSLDQGATLEVTGDKPLVIASSSTIVIAGVLNAASRGGTGGPPSTGPGANGPDCTAGLDSTGNSDGGGGGGALGAAGGPGGSGSNGNGGDAGQVIGLQAYLRGGCPGGRGGQQAGGKPGAGGGAIELVARDSVTVTGSINAGGGGGEGGARSQTSGGGGGGGSGGMIRFDSPAVSFAGSAFIAANGGGGGGGAESNNAGGPGADGALTMSNAKGGSSKDHGGGTGGAAARITGEQGSGGNEGGGGGGGGGAVGFVVVHSASFSPATAMVSPGATQP
jgi:hypothetical protein